MSAVDDDLPPVAVRLTEHEIFKIKLSQSSLTNSVIVCPTVVKLYLWDPSEQETWTYEKTGVPILLLLDKSPARNVAETLQLCLVDRTTGFSTWRECLTPKSNYSASQRDFHTMKSLTSEFYDGPTTTNTEKMAGLRFPNDETAAMFMKEVEGSMPSELDFVTASPKQKAKEEKLEKEKAKNARRIKKDEISSPCMFTHVTSINNKHFQTNNGNTSPSQGTGRRTLSFGKRK